MKARIFRKGDALLLLAVAVAAALGFLWLFTGKEAACTAVVEQNGVEIRRISLQELTQPISLELNGGYPLVLAADREGVWVEDASCPDKTCARTGKITRPGQTVVCLPARISVRLVGNPGAAIDGMTG